MDFLIVIYKNYELLYLQSDNFKRLFDEKKYKLIFIDNTPEADRKQIEYDRLTSNCVVHINTEPDHSHDGASQGSAIDFGRKYCTSDVICIMDSDFFIVDPNFISHEFVQNILETNNIEAIGTEYYDGEPTISQSWIVIRKHHEDKFTNIPCCFCMFMTPEVLNCASWKVTASESSDNRQNSFIETGWRIRKHILDYNIPTLAFKGFQPFEVQGTEFPTYFKYNDKVMGFHFQRGSHRRLNLTDIEIPELLSREY